jgi:hypothetical protein
LVVRRKNWLFSGTPAGAQASALLYSLVETAKANGLEPYGYLRNIFEKLPHAVTVEDIEALLPLEHQAGYVALLRDKKDAVVGVLTFIRCQVKRPSGESKACTNFSCMYME